MRTLFLAIALVAVTFATTSCGETCKVCESKVSSTGTPDVVTSLGEKCGTELETIEATAPVTQTVGSLTVTTSFSCK